MKMRFMIHCDILGTGTAWMRSHVPREECIVVDIST